MGFFLPAALVLAGLSTGSGVSPLRLWCIFLLDRSRTPLFSPFDLWLNKAHTLDFMRVSGRWLGVNRPDQKPCKPVLRIESIEQCVLLIPIRRWQMVLQPEQAQGLRLAAVEDVAHHQNSAPNCSQLGVFICASRMTRGVPAHSACATRLL